MDGTVVIDNSGKCRVQILNGDSFEIDKKALPESLENGDSIKLMLVPVGEAADQSQARDLLNELLYIEA
ncbi:hypothetical protein CL632_03415 [bacterium]|jgi:hypothetical protein|nr:hypothetical protein [bacterium]MDP6571534.1 hypothetical protein [Patescibacteria group bacterium]MDP6756408.1 hypothetical protein [Patescibacteria group bacterium]|tara:strand:+ start:15676 stop:15882 length:207 start_codon:yes stop_codon:yes gene_type:complete